MYRLGFRLLFKPFFITILSDAKWVKQEDSPAAQFKQVLKYWFSPFVA